VVVEAMREIGVDLSSKNPRRLGNEDFEWADHVVTMGCGEVCPVLPGKRFQDWDLPDPANRSLEEVRALRGEIAERVERLISDLEQGGVV
jgi:arsenate reductase (thioredoxin)